MKGLLLAGVVVAGASLYMMMPQAKAADGDAGCGGKLIEYVPFTVNGQKIGQLQLYYNAQNGMNCAVMLHGGATWGVARDTGVALFRKRRGDQYYTEPAFERDTFRYQAGPIRTAGDGWCVKGGGGITHGGKHYTLYTGDHCG
ncbi:hypothetical protein U1872_05935 [Sphingomonas sp. RB3P16]|uniref:hypothetical protein n=1 Tax=Parasphingomonas frigoris TaxID=3096163 RepID=UPI002FC58C95